MSLEHVWFNPRLLRLPINATSDLEWHRAWLKLSDMNVCLMDTTGLSKEYGNNFKMQDMTSCFDISSVRDVANGKYWHNNFGLLMSRLSDGVFQAAGDKEELRLSYSGGTDSCLILAALLSNRRIDEWIDGDRFVIYTTPHAKKEDPLIWNRIIELGYPIRFLDYDILGTDTGNSLMLTGEGNAYGTWHKIMTPDFTEAELFTGSYTHMKSKVQAWFLRREPSGLAWEFFDKLILTYGDSDGSLYQAWSLFEHRCAEQCYMFRQGAYGGGPVTIDPGKNSRWFMMDNDFWDMCEYESQARIYTSDDTLKYSSLKYIADWMKWSHVHKKRKISSQFMIPKIIRKSQIYSDFSYTENTNLNEHKL